MSTANPTAERLVILDDVTWQTFRELASGARGGRWAYDRGRMEIMSPSFEHESMQWLLGRFVEASCEAIGIGAVAAGSTTLERADLARGIEADECSDIDSAALIAGKSEVDLPADPPPDLVIEVGVTRSSLDKLSIRAALGIPEVWRRDGGAMTVYCSSSEGEYKTSNASEGFVRVPYRQREPAAPGTRRPTKRGTRSPISSVPLSRGRRS